MGSRGISRRSLHDRPTQGQRTHEKHLRFSSSGDSKDGGETKGEIWYDGKNYVGEGGQKLDPKIETPLKTVSKNMKCSSRPIYLGSVPRQSLLWRD